jgi:hypothetical protein
MSAQIEQRKMVGIVRLGSLPVVIRACTQRRHPHAASHASSAPCIDAHPPRQELLVMERADTAVHQLADTLAIPPLFHVKHHRTPMPILSR